MTPQQRIESDVKTALKAGEKERLGTLRMLLADLKNERIRAGAEVDEAGFVTLLRKAIKQRNDAAEGFRKGDREESAAKEEREAAILEEYLPEQADEADVRAAIEKFVADEGLSGPQAMGRVMGTMIKKFGASADGGTISRIARQVLAD
ncbi:MAG TPA: GatB/YqeY domain-containing protein [Thermoanaerobaculia bacterium]|nr:GatB/YqeY domain-containing protein [Thermoanaerobaculia bacterium]